MEATLTHAERAREDGHHDHGSVMVGFTVNLPELPMCDIEGQAEVFMQGDRYVISDIQRLVKVVRTSSILGRTLDRYEPFPSTPVGNALEAAIRAKLDGDRDWWDDAIDAHREAA